MIHALHEHIGQPQRGNREAAPVNIGRGYAFSGALDDSKCLQNVIQRATQRQNVQKCLSNIPMPLETNLSYFWDTTLSCLHCEVQIVFQGINIPIIIITFRLHE